MEINPWCPLSIYILALEGVAVDEVGSVLHLLVHHNVVLYHWDYLAEVIVELLKWG